MQTETPKRRPPCSPETSIACHVSASDLSILEIVLPRHSQRKRTVVGSTLFTAWLSGTEDPARYVRTLLGHHWFLWTCKLIIAFVSAYDIFLTIKYVEYLPMMEQNPLGRWLMNLDGGTHCELHQIAFFVSAKAIGNFLAFSVIELLSNWRMRIASGVALAVAICQLVLLAYLLC